MKGMLITPDAHIRRAHGNRIDFDDTYDGLGDQLEEADDNFNDDTFGGGGGSSTKPVGKDFDFFGSTSKVTNAINEEAARFNRQQLSSKPLVASTNSPKKVAKPFRSGYEAYKNPTHIPDLQVDADLWGTEPSKREVKGPQPCDHGISGSQQRGFSSTPTKKMMSLEEVEAAMRRQPKKPNQSAAVQQQAQIPSSHTAPQPRQQAPQVARFPQQQTQYPEVQPHQNLAQIAHISGARSTSNDVTPRTSHPASRSSQILQAELPARASPAPQTVSLNPSAGPPQILIRPQEPQYQAQDLHETPPLPQPRQILQNPNRLSGQLASRPPESTAPAQETPRTMLQGQNGAHPPLPIIYHPSQIIHLPEQERNAYLVEEAKRAKRNHKIFMLSKGNGLMTPQDKNFITRIQLQQLMTATGNVNENDPDASLFEDFYYQVYNQIENRPRQNPQQPLSNFAQTYLFRTGGRQGGMGRRHRGGDSHMQRMEQQVQRAVEAAKAKPKNKQLVIEGSLGKISFSNAKTPKPLLNIKRQDSSDVTNRPTASSKKLPQNALSTTDRKAILKNIEIVYSTLMKMEDHDRRLPPPPTAESDALAIQQVIDWQELFQELNQKLWMSLKVTEPIMPNSTILHPFIAFLSYPKGKKAIPRIFNHIDQEQRLTILTMVMVHLDILDVVRQSQPEINGTQLPSVAREQVELFLQTVMPNLFSYATDAALHIVIGLLGLVIERVNLHAVVRTRAGLEVLTMLLSRAAIVKASDGADDETWDQWLNIYNRFFDLVEPMLGDIFPRSVNTSEDQYVWQFLASTGSGANPEQQQRLVLAVK